MKTYCKRLTITPDRIDAAVGAWLLGRAGKKNDWRIKAEYGSRENLVSEIKIEIRERRLIFAPIKRHPRHEPTNGKLRIICVESIKQQICDYLAVQCLEDFLNAKTGFYQIGSSKGKGGLFAKKTIEKWITEGGYYVKSDVKQCYPSIKPARVKKILRKYIKSADVLYLCETLLDTYEDGLDIGSYFSLKISCLVLSFAYHHIEAAGKLRRGKWKSGITHQIWNMDDCLFMSRDKRDLKRAVRDLQQYMEKELGLTLKPWKICKVSDGEPINMCGYRVYTGKTRLRRRLFICQARAYRRFEKHRTTRRARRCCSYWGYLLSANAEQYRAARGVDRTQGDACRKISRSEKGAKGGKRVQLGTDPRSKGRKATVGGK